MLPLVGAIAGDIMKLANDLSERKSRLDALGIGQVKRLEAYADELAQSEKMMGDDAVRLQGLLEELCDLGVRPQALEKGQVAFPTLLNEELAFFTWQCGDEEVSSWHLMEEDFLKGQSFDSLFGHSDN